MWDSLEDRELIVLVLALLCGAAAFGLRELRTRVPGWAWLVAAFGARLAGWTLTVGEDLLSGGAADAANAAEHLFVLGSSALLLAWVVRHGRAVLVR